MNTRHRYQCGFLTRRKRIRTEDVWQFRYYETTPEGRRCRRSKIIGTLVVAVCLGLRASEVIGLQWGDLNWEDLTLLVRRSVVHGRVGDTKTEASRLPLPVDPRLADALKEQWRRSRHQGPSDWVFANQVGNPRWQESILRRQIKLAPARAGIGKIGWHTFHHSYSTLLRRVGADIKVQQELLRHSTIQSTMNVYTQAMSEGKRAANSVVVRSVLPFETCGGVTAA